MAIIRELALYLDRGGDDAKTEMQNYSVLSEKIYIKNDVYK
jgi:hypothetical protein